MDDNKSDRLTFWRNWYTATRQLPDDLRLAWLDAVLDFAFTGKEPQPAETGASVDNGIMKAIGYQAVQMVRATIEISRKRKQSGSRGGASHKQNASKTQAKRKQIRKPRKQDKEQVQEQVQEQEHNANSYPAHARKQPPTLDQFLAGATLAGVPDDFARKLYNDLVGANWEDGNGLYVTNWRRYLRSAFLSEKKSSAACDSHSPAAPRTIDDFKIGR